MTRRPRAAECSDGTTCLRPNVLTCHKISPDPVRQKARHSKWKNSEHLNQRQPTRKRSTNRRNQKPLLQNNQEHTKRQQQRHMHVTSNISDAALCFLSFVFPIFKVGSLRQTQFGVETTETYNFLGHPGAPGNSISTPLRVLTAASHTDPRQDALWNNVNLTSSGMKLPSASGAEVEHFGRTSVRKRLVNQSYDIKSSRWQRSEAQWLLTCLEHAVWERGDFPCWPEIASGTKKEIEVLRRDGVYWKRVDDSWTAGTALRLCQFLVDVDDEPARQILQRRHQIS